MRDGGGAEGSGNTDEDERAEEGGFLVHRFRHKLVLGRLLGIGPPRNWLLGRHLGRHLGGHAECHVVHLCMVTGLGGSPQAESGGYIEAGSARWAGNAGGLV